MEADLVSSHSLTEDLFTMDAQMPDKETVVFGVQSIPEMMKILLVRENGVFVTKLAIWDTGNARSHSNTARLLLENAPTQIIQENGAVSAIMNTQLGIGVIVATAFVQEAIANERELERVNRGDYGDCVRAGAKCSRQTQIDNKIIEINPTSIFRNI